MTEDSPVKIKDKKDYKETIVIPDSPIKEVKQLIERSVHKYLVKMIQLGN